VHRDLQKRIAAALAEGSPRRVEVDGARQAAVLIPIVAGDDPHLIFTLRTDTVGSHKGQISFPGGSLDPGEPPSQAALRESHEEIGLDPARVRVLGELDSMPTFVSGFVITPVVGWLQEPVSLSPNPTEVAAVIDVPLRALADSARLEPGFTRGGRAYPTEAWVYDDHIIWGVTARLIRVFLERLADAGIVERPAPTNSPWPDPAGSEL
jgi:8-oxo-dGTP pyrophosphatase MutT (NUDIX family)